MRALFCTWVTIDDYSTDELWRRGRDSNPRYGFPHTHFPGVRLQPLGHPSALAYQNGANEAHSIGRDAGASRAGSTPRAIGTDVAVERRRSSARGNGGSNA